MFHQIRKMSLITFFTLTLGSKGICSEWKWEDFEIVGYDETVNRKQIIDMIPLTLGSKFSQDIEEWNKWCKLLEEKFNLLKAECSSVRFADFKAYFVIDIVNHRDAHRLIYRISPTQTLDLANGKILDIHRNLETRMWNLFEEGIPPQESSQMGYLDYDDTIMHEYALDLIKEVPNYTHNLLDVIMNDKDLNKRATASKLLNWATKPEDIIIKIHPYLDDSSVLVRNDLSRFMLHWVNKVKDETQRKNIIDSLVRQLERPSHADRNKALYNLLNLADTQESRNYIKQKALTEIKIIAEQSILPNAGAIAKQMLGELNKVSSETN